MGQIKTQGNITIIDTTDIESIVVEYARNQSTSTPPTSGWSTTRPAWAQGYYIWQRTRIHKSGTQTSQDTFGDAVCLTGSTGQTGAAGRSLTSMVTQYTIAANSVTITQSNMSQYTWTNNVPTYNGSTPVYWVRVTNTYSNPSSTEYIIYKDNGITDAMATAATANSIAQHAQEDADGALGQASVSIKEIYRVWYRTDSATAPAKPTAHVTQTSNDVTKTWTKNKPIDNTNNRYYFYCDETITNGGISSWTEPVLDTSNLSQYEVNALSAKLKNFWWDSNGAHAASGISGNSVTENTASTYGYNSLMGVTGFSIGYNAAKVIDLKTTPSPASLDMYQPPSISGTTVTQGAKTVSLSGNALTFYNPSTGNAQLIIGANGTLQSGNYSRGPDSKFSSNGTKIDLVNGDIITKYFRVSQGLESGLTTGVYVHGTIEALDGTIGTDSINYWEIGNDIDYNLNSTAKMVGHGSSYIQLGDSSTWRLATNRIHTGWYTSDDSLLHFPAIDSKYWDFGIHAPTAATEKLLYIRKSKANTSASNVLTNLLYDIDDSYATPQWDYMFYISANGSLYAKNLYVLDDNGNPIQIGGTDGVYLLKSGGTITGNLEVNGTLTKGGKTVTYLTSTPTNGQILVADGTSGSIKTSGYTIATSVPSGAIFTDKNVQTSQANTTKIYLAGTSTTGTTTGTLNFDSNVYLTTTAGTLHATTFEGNLSGTATKANQDSDGNVIKTTYLKLSGGNVTGPVTFGSSVSADELTVGDLVVNGSGSFTNNLQVNTINGVTVGSSPKFTDTVTTVTTSGNGNAVTAITASNGKLTVTKGTTFLTSYTETDPIFVASAAHGITSTDISNWNSKTSNTGTVTSVRVQASSPLTSTTSTASSTTLDTTIKFANQNKNLVLAGPSSGNAAAPTFRSLVADDIPGLAWSKITSGKPTTLSGYGITDAAGSNAIVGLNASSNSAGVTTFTATRASGTDPLSFEVSIVASAATGASALKDSNGLISKGNATKPVYFNNGVPAEANTYAGGTAVTLNGSSKASSTASFYAPTASGTSGQYLKSNGANSAPTWATLTIPTITDTYSATSTNGMSGKAVASAIGALDGNLNSTTPGAGKTLTAFSQTDGIVSATFGNISITKSQISDFPTSMPPSSHTHDDRYYTETEIDTRLKKFIPYAHYSNKNGDNSGKYYKISINSYTSWMLSFIVRIYHNYKAYDVQISGYNYGKDFWYTPEAVILGASTTETISISFGYDSAWHLWIAIPAQQYSGVDVVHATNGYTQVDNLEDLFTIEMVTGLPETVQSTKTAYRPWYRNETVTNATNATNAVNATNATNATNDSDNNPINSTYLKRAGGTMTGLLNFTYDKQAISFRPNSTSYDSGLVYETNGNECLAFVQQNQVTSFMVVHGSDPASWNGGTWTTATPTIQTKYKSLYVNELIANGVTPEFNFKVNGTSYLNGSTTVNGNTLKITNNSNTVTIGSLNSNFTHIYNSANIPFIFNHSVLTTSGDLGNNSYPFTNVNIKGAYNMLVGSTQKANMHYDSTLEAIVFSFA